MTIHTKHNIIMKSHFLLVAAGAVLMVSCGPKFEIEGTFANLDDTTAVERQVILSSPFGGISDTTMTVDGKFTFKGVCETPMPYSISVEGMMGSAQIFLENAKFTVKIEQSGPYILSSVVRGGETQEVYYSLEKAYEDALSSRGIVMKDLMEEYNAPETTQERREELIAGYEAAMAESDSVQKAITDAYLAANPMSYFALCRIMERMENSAPEKIAAEFEAFRNSADFAGHPVAVKISEYLESVKHLMAGQPAPDFTLPDTEGKDVTFSSVYSANKLTLLDFWAGWCGPCRAFNPALVEIYNEFHQKGFEIVGVSMDRDRDYWLKAIKEDGLPWIQLSDVAYWNTEPRKLYNVNYIPQNVLVDSEGKIVASKLDEEGLKAILGEKLQ